MRVIGLLLISAASLLMAAGCGGGGGGGGRDSGTSLTLDKSTIHFVTDTLAAPIPSQTIVATFRGDGLVVGSLPGAVVPPWLIVDAPQNGTSPVTVRVSVLPAAGLVRGRQSTTLRFATGKADGSEVVTRDVNVSLTIDHLVTPAVTRLGATTGASAPATASLTLTGANITWEAFSNQPWLQVTPASGTGSATLNVSASAASLAVGPYVGTITVRDPVTARLVTATIDLSVIPRRLEVLPRGIALSSTLGASLLSRQVQVKDTGGQGGRWRASSDASWLQLGATSGVAGDSLTISADPGGLADGIHYATVTIAPDNEPALANSATVRVGFHVDRTNPAPPDTITTGYVYGVRDIVADPIRPYFYVSQTNTEVGGTTNSQISVYHAYTGQLVHTLSFPGQWLGNIAISQDGSLLVAAETQSSLIPIALAGSTRTVGTPWTGMRHQDFELDLAFTQVGGEELIVTSQAQLLSAANGAVRLANMEGVEPSFLDLGAYVVAEPDGGAAYLMRQTLANHSFARVSLSNFNGTLRAVQTHLISESGDGLDMAMNWQGNRLVTLSLDAEAVRVYDTDTMAILGRRGAELGNAGHLDLAYTGDIYVTGWGRRLLSRYDANLVQLGEREVTSTPGDYVSQGTVSSDGQRVCIAFGATRLRFFSATLAP